jgi:hypoxanthine phosphoribosyltransferase
LRASGSSGRPGTSGTSGGKGPGGPRFGKALIDAATLARRVEQLGKQITADYAGREILAVGVLKGAAFFYTDLVRHIARPLVVDFLRAGSYGGRTSTSGEVRIFTDEDAADVAGRHVLIVEDIVDSGVTMQYLRKLFLAKDPASLATCTLLDKPARRRIEVPLDYVGFKVADVFVVGYGMDHGDRYRNLPYIAALDEVQAP